MAKRCRHCGETKEASEFRANPRMRDGLSSWCAECHNAASRRWRDKQRALVEEALAARDRARVEALRARRRERQARIEALRREHFERLRAQAARRR